MSNTRVTVSKSANNARSESCIAINHKKPWQIVAGSKKFRDLQTYDFTLATAYSHDSGHHWHASEDLPLLPGYPLLTDPDLAWDDSDNIFLVGLAGSNPPKFDAYGIVVYKSTDQGQTWSAPKLIHTSSGDDKQWAAGDAHPTSPYSGQVYAVWMDNGESTDCTVPPGDLYFARTLDHGTTWVGTGNDVTPSIIASGSSSSPLSDIVVAQNGDIYVVFLDGNDIKLLVSTDGGSTFAAPMPVASGITTLFDVMHQVHGWPVFSQSGGNFRLTTTPTVCVYGQRVMVAWADGREKTFTVGLPGSSQPVSRIYYAFSLDGGASWLGDPSGQPLPLTRTPESSFHHFHPQLATDPNGAVGCAFYEFGLKTTFGRPPDTPLIDVILAQSPVPGPPLFMPFSNAAVTDQPWDPTFYVPWAHYCDPTSDSWKTDSNLTFIGEYFGLDASAQGFYPLWTDTRFGSQELWTAIVPTESLQTFSQLSIRLTSIEQGMMAQATRLQAMESALTAQTERVNAIELQLGRAVNRLEERMAVEEQLKKAPRQWLLCRLFRHGS
jgi:hypothetical protein